MSRLPRALLVVPLLAGLVVIGRGHGFPVSRMNLSGGGAWLASSSVGQLSLIDGASAEVVAQVRVAAGGSELAAVQDGENAYAADLSSGTVVRVDGATYRASPAVRLLAGSSNSLEVFAGRHTLFALDHRSGVVVLADPVSLQVKGSALSMAASVAEGAGVVDDGDRLWLLDQSSGDLVWIDQGRKRVRSRVVDPARGKLVLVGGRPGLVDLARRTVWALDPRSGKPGRAGCIDVATDDPTVRVSGSPLSDDRVYATSGQRGLLLVSDLRHGQCSTAVQVSDPGDELGTPQAAGGHVFVPDFSTGAVIIVDLAAQRVVGKPEVLDPGRQFELLAKDGIVFYNDLHSERAGVIRLDGTVRQTRKFNPRNPGRGLVGTGRTGSPPPIGGPSSSSGPLTTTTTGPPPPAGAVRLEISGDRGQVGDAFGFRVVPTGGGTIRTARWSFGDQASAEGLAVSHAWQRPGTFTVLVQVTLTDGRQQVLSAVVVITAPAPSTGTTPTGPAAPTTKTTQTTPAKATVSGVRASPATYQGACPVTITFTGKISVDSGPVTVRYAWSRSDGTTGTLHSISFTGTGAQSQSVQTTWRVGTPGSQSSGWEAVKITSPTAVTSGHANFTVDCTSPPKVTVSPATPSPASYQGYCPVTVKDVATISVGSGPVTVRYAWSRSDGTTGTAQSLTFSGTGAQSQTVTDTWTVNKTLTGWEEVKITSPTALSSGGAKFTVDCVPKITVTAMASPQVYQDFCPVTITFTAVISVDRGPVTVNYEWMRSDGGIDTNPGSVTFSGTGPQSQAVQRTWYFNTSGQQYSGWEQLHVTNPVSVYSNRADFTINCLVIG